MQVDKRAYRTIIVFSHHSSQIKVGSSIKNVLFLKSVSPSVTGTEGKQLCAKREGYIITGTWYVRIRHVHQ